MRSPVHYYGLDLLRFGAAWLVVIDHFGSFGWASPTASAQGDALAFPWLERMTHVGSIGVEIFFLISGFVIAASALNATASQFLISRAIRVLPTLWICGLIALTVRALAGEPLHLLLNYFLRSASLSPAGPYIDGVVWTLVVEAVFYAVIFFMLVKNVFDKIEIVAKVMGVLSAVFLLVLGCAFLLRGMDPHVAKLAAICERFPFKVFLLRHGVFFALGMLLWAGFDKGFKLRDLAWMGGLSIFCSLEIMIDRGAFPDIALSLAIWWISFAFIIVSIWQAERIGRYLQRGKRPLQDAGRFSYPLYLNHYTFGMVIVPVLFATGLPRVAVFVLALLIVSASSFVIMRYPERWVQQRLRERFMVRKQTATRDGRARATVR